MPGRESPPNALLPRGWKSRNGSARLISNINVGRRRKLLTNMAESEQTGRGANRDRSVCRQASQVRNEVVDAAIRSSVGEEPGTDLAC